jgi:hypothetical protein
LRFTKDITVKTRTCSALDDLFCPEEFFQLEISNDELWYTTLKMLWLRVVFGHFFSNAHLNFVLMDDGHKVDVILQMAVVAIATSA